ncbi:hypothetical protein LCGC14_0392850 [marine sediment metagenome]|uniref:Uncharacterized protein n=1 Tax=marine sediment metagenome TaxID=412755 RepID=A0A0F9T4T6_9ZZZZ
MPNGKEFVSPTQELQDEFNAELAKANQRIEQQFLAMPATERLKTNVDFLKLRARHDLVSRFQRIAGAEELRLSLQAGTIPEPAMAQAQDYLHWKDQEAVLIREELVLEQSIRNKDRFMTEIGAPTVLTKLAQFFYSKIGQVAGVPDYRASGLYEKALELYNADVERLREIAKEKSTVITYQSLYEGLANYMMSGKVTSYEDLFTLTNDDGEPITRFTEIGQDDPNLQQIFNEVSSAILGLPPETDIKGKNYAEIVAELAKKPRPLPPAGLSRITIEGILKDLTASAPPPQLPSGLATVEEAFAVLQEAGVPEELIAELEDVEEYTRQLEGYWEAISANQEAVIQGLEEAKLPEMGIAAILLQTISQPALTALDVFGQLYHQWIAPWGGFLFRLRAEAWEAWKPQYMTKSERSFLAIYREARNTEDWWHAGGQALAEAELGFADRFIFEWVVDPITYLGLGVGKAIIGIAAKAGATGRVIRPIGATINLFDTAWLKSWDVLIFDRIKNVGKFIGKTPVQASKSFANADMQAVNRFLHAATNGRLYRNIPLDQAKELLLKARGAAVKNPALRGPAGDAGRALLRTNQMDEAMVKGLGKRLGTELEVTKEMVLNVSSVVNGQIQSIGGQLLTRKASAPFLLRVLGVAESKASLTLARKEIKRLFNAGISNSDNIMAEAKNTADLLAQVFKHSQNVYMDEVTSVAAHNLSMSGRIAATWSRIEWTTMNVWRNTIDRWAVTPQARMYLAFSAYGPGNILEGFIKPLLARQIPWNPLNLLKSGKPTSVINPTARVQRLTSGLSIPPEIFEGVPRIEMAGETPGMLGIQHMSKNLRRWRSILSAGPVGRFFIDWPGRIGLHQRSEYYRKAFVSFLGDEEATAVMRGLTKTIDDTVKTVPDEWLRSLNLSTYELKEELLERAITGPATTRSLLDDIVSDRLATQKGITKDVAMADRVAGGRVTESLGKYPLVDEPFGDTLLQAASDGSLWAKAGKGIDDAIESIKATKYDSITHSPEFYRTRMKERVDEILGMEARTKEEFTGMMQELQELQKFYGESTDDVIRAMNELETLMQKRMKWQDWNNWRGSYSKGVYDGLAGYGDDALKQFDRMMKKLQKDMARHFTIPEQASVTKLFTAWSDEQRFLTKWWKKQRQTELDMIATKPKGRAETSEFWLGFRAMQDKAHAQRRMDQAKFVSSSIKQENSTSKVLGVSGPEPPVIDASGRQLTRFDLANIFNSNPAQTPSSVLRIETMTIKSRAEFILGVKTQADRMGQQVGKTGEALGWTDDAIGEVYDYILRDMRMSPATASVMEPHLMELKALQDELWSIYRTKAVPKGMADDFSKWVDDLATELDGIKGYTSKGAVTPEFAASKQRAADKASKEYFKDWADYTNENATTAAMRTVYPFWTYELHRLFWLPRSSIRTPGVFKSWGTYLNYTEDGYIHIPGTSLEFNPLRGTVFMGGLLRLIRRDYPEYYDQFPAVSEFFDWYSRFGFYPAFYLNYLKVFGGTSAKGQPQFGELLPAWFKTPLNLYIAAFPDSAPAKVMLNTILPEPYRNYMTILIANAISQREEKPFNGMEIWDKLQENEDLTPEEQEVWTRATQQHGWMGAIMEQAGVLRIRTEEQLAAWEASSKLIEEKTGYGPEEQLWIRRHGFRIGDYAQLDSLDQDVIAQMDAVKYHSGIFSSIMPTAWQEEDRRRREFFREIRDYGDTVRLDQEELDRQVRDGELNMGQWTRNRSDIRSRYTNFFDDLSETDRYKDVALELEDIVREDGTIREGLISRAEKREQLPPVQHPSEELLNFYYSIQLEKKLDLASGKRVDDWDGYFLKIDAIISTLDGVEREDFILVITKNMTDLEKLRWNVSRRYFRGYNRRQEAVLGTQFNEEEQAVIRQWIFGTPAERDIAQEVEHTSGRKLVSFYQSQVATIGTNLRSLSPELDAWLQFFEITDTTKTDAAAILYGQYRDEWGIPR